MCLRLVWDCEECCDRVLAKRQVRGYLEIGKWTTAMALRLEREEWDILAAEIHTSCTAQGLKEHFDHLVRNLNVAFYSISSTLICDRGKIHLYC